MSELKKRQPHPVVVQWFDERPPSALYLSVLTLGELRKGIEAITDPCADRVTSTGSKTTPPQYFPGRILPIEVQVADRWGRMCASVSRPLPAIDSLLAATALAFDLILVTRNLHDLSLPEVRVFNPWEG
ncbi:type II toxin-antitoxin system VapC family toxin [Igneacidithiobacillus copahuensis]|uniref:type II toxin-antitoxin system VapC family toxin n=1 Tax=Igneacidithiobacillus copahuensis TaxID=2724909 RepID=UPI001D003A0E|nr:type II toxin-antitoxin system VapC family toxin [Igneacidithiobacillus copahuensis]